VPRITDFCSCIYAYGRRLSLVTLCDSDFGITPVVIPKSLLLLLLLLLLQPTYHLICYLLLLLLQYAGYVPLCPVMSHYVPLCPVMSRYVPFTLPNSCSWYNNYEDTDMWDSLLTIVVESWVPLEGIYGDVFRGVCTQSLVLIEQPVETRLQLFTWITNVSCHTKLWIIILWRYLLSRSTETHFITKPMLPRISKSNRQI